VLFRSTDSRQQA